MKRSNYTITALIAFIICLQFSTSVLKAQSDTNSKPFVHIDKPPTYPGGYMKYINENIKYPKEALAKRIEGKVSIEAVIDKNGFIKNIRIMEDPGAGLGEEAERIIKSMPKWDPAIRGGEPIETKVKFPVYFTLTNEKLKGRK